MCRSSREQLAARGKWMPWPEVCRSAASVVAAWTGLDRAWRRQQRGGDAAFVPGGDAAVSLQRRTALAAQDSMLVLLYSSICPGRGSEYWSLQFAASPSQAPSPERPNLLCICPVNGALLRLSEHKTARSVGAEEVPLPGQHFEKVIASLLALRPALLCGKQHSFVFARADGQPFSTSGKWSQYLQRVFARGWRASRTIGALDADADDAGDAPSISVNSLRKGKPPPFALSHTVFSRTCARLAHVAHTFFSQRL